MDRLTPRGIRGTYTDRLDNRQINNQSFPPREGEGPVYFKSRGSALSLALSSAERGLLQRASAGSCIATSSGN